MGDTYRLSPTIGIATLLLAFIASWADSTKVLEYSLLAHPSLMENCIGMDTILHSNTHGWIYTIKSTQYIRINLAARYNCPMQSPKQST